MSIRKILYILLIVVGIISAFQVKTGETIYPGAVFTSSSQPKTGLDSIRVYICIDTAGIVDSIDFAHEIGYGLYATQYTVPDSMCVLRFIFRIISADSDSVDQSYMWSEYLVGYGGVDMLDTTISSRAAPGDTNTATWLTLADTSYCQSKGDTNTLTALDIWTYTTRTLTSWGNPMGFIARTNDFVLLINGERATSYVISQYEDITQTAQIIGSDGNGIDLTDWTEAGASLRMIARRSKDPSSEVIIPDTTVTITDAANGMIEFSFSHNQLNVNNGTYPLEFYGIKADSTIRVFGIVKLKIDISIHPR